MRRISLEDAAYSAVFFFSNDKIPANQKAPLLLSIVDMLGSHWRCHVNTNTNSSLLLVTMEL
jgi:hypothetical protein